MSKTKILNSKEGYKITADYYDKKVSYWDSFEKDMILPLLGNLEDKKILDIGAGTGRLSERMVKNGAEVFALDISKEMLDKIRTKKVKKIIGDAENLDFSDDSFDIIVATFLIVHLKDPTRFFDEVYRVLKPDGKFLLTNINQRKAPAVKTAQGLIEIESYYHRPDYVLEKLESMAFGVDTEKFVYEGENWINQIILLSK